MKAPFIKRWACILLVLLSMVPALAGAQTGSSAQSASQYQGWTLWGLLMLVPGIVTGLTILWLAATAPAWRRRHLHHW
ncbi:MAG TPA: hypothetical protein VH639_12195 [Bryobacteraceae bacterium]|jgi:hypothetical protein